MLAPVLLLFAAACDTGAQTLIVTFRGMAPLAATATDQNGQSFTVTGLSGLTWLQDTRFAAVMDNSDKVVFLDVTLNPDGSIVSATIAGGLTLSESRDFEGIAFTTIQRDSFFLSEEGTPSVREFSRSTGALLQTLATPAVFLNRRSNLGFESLARHPAGAELWTANEEALTLDSAPSTPKKGTLVRLLRYSLVDDSATPAQQFAYRTEPMHGGAIAGGRSGLVDLAVLPDGKVLALERSLALSLPNLFQTRLYELDFASATDVSGFANGLTGQTFTPVAKRLLWTGSLGNLEGLAIGPLLANGDRSLLAIVDDGDALSTSHLVAFELVDPVRLPCAANLSRSAGSDLAHAPASVVDCVRDALRP